METNALSRLHYRFLQQNAGKTFQCTRYADFVVFRRNVPLVFVGLSDRARNRCASVHAETYQQSVLLHFQNIWKVLYATSDSTNRKDVWKYKHCDAIRLEIKRNFWNASWDIRYISQIIQKIETLSRTTFAAFHSWQKCLWAEQNEALQLYSSLRWCDFTLFVMEYGHLWHMNNSRQKGILRNGL